jgi:hypothetical protein
MAVHARDVGTGPAHAGDASHPRPGRTLPRRRSESLPGRGQFFPPPRSDRGMAVTAPQPASPGGQPTGSPDERTANVRNLRQTPTKPLVGQIGEPAWDSCIGLISGRLPDDSRQFEHLSPQILYPSSQKQILPRALCQASSLTNGTVCPRQVYTGTASAVC